MNLQYEHIITGRKGSLFTEEVGHKEKELIKAFRGSRVAVVGAAGSIGSSVVKTLLRFQPNSLTLLDLSENNLVELVRDLRSTINIHLPVEFVSMPIGMGSVEFDRYFAEEKPFDYLLNLAAMKHVRTERNTYSLIRMIDTNVLFLNSFLEQNRYPFRNVFSVSSDKATNPANLMGATKMIMEKALIARSGIQPFSSARFANVAFSDGSLPFGFLHRIQKHQPISAPKDVRRYFISHLEAGELCVLSCALGANREVFFPKLRGQHDEKTFAQIAEELLLALGYEPVECSTEEEAKSRASELIPNKRWPCYFFKSDTTGEKDFEEFYAESEVLDLKRYKRVGVVIQATSNNDSALKEFLAFALKAKKEPSISKGDYVQEILKVVPTLQHHETGRNLDEKM